MKCVICNRLIDPDYQYPARYHVHERCLLKKCAKCGLTPLKQGYFVGRNKIYCRKCYDAHEKELEQRTGDETS